MQNKTFFLNPNHTYICCVQHNNNSLTCVHSQLKTRSCFPLSQAHNKRDDLGEAHLTLAIFGEDTGGNATDILLADAGVADLQLEEGQGDDLDVSQVGQHCQVVLTVIISLAAAKVGNCHLPYPAALQGCQLELQFGADLGQREDLSQK